MLTGNAPQGPSDHHRWTVQTLNIHGAVFERWVEHVFDKAGAPWTVVATQFPVEYPLPEGPTRGHESTLDVWADYRLDKRWVSLLVECKKNDPRFVDWVFVRARGKEAGVAPLSGLDIRVSDEGTTGIAVVRLVDAERKAGPLAVVASDARELRGQYEDIKRNQFTRTSTKSIGDAAYQVTLAAHAIISEQYRTVRTQIERGVKTPEWERRLFIPVVATTANLFVADFDPAQVDSHSGTIPIAAVTLEPTEWSWYLYPVPRHLQFAAPNALWMIDKGLHFLVSKMPIAVVRSSYLSSFLSELPTDPREWRVSQD